MMENASVKVSEKTGQAVETIKQWSLVQNYLVPAAQWTGRKYRKAPMAIRFALVSFAALSAIPLAIFLGFMGVVTAGCLVLGGLAVMVVEVNMIFWVHVLSRVMMLCMQQQLTIHIHILHYCVC